MIDNIKILLGLTDASKDDLLQVLVDGAIEDAINFTGDENIKDKAQGTIQKMVIYNYNRMGTEGLTSERYSDTSYNYDNDYPDYIIRGLRALRQVKFY